MHNDGGIVPDTALVYSVNDESFVKLLKVEGTGPVKTFLWSDNQTSRAKLPNSDGMLPANLLSERSKYVSDVKLPKLSGIVPVSSELVKSNFLSLVRLPKQKGTVPVNDCACEKANSVSCVIPHKESGIVPDIVVSATSIRVRFASSLISEGMEPPKLPNNTKSRF